MAFTTTQRVKDLTRDQGTAFHHAPVEGAITNAVNGANAFLEKIGVATSTTDSGLLIAADRLAISYIMEGEITRMLLRGETSAIGSFRLAVDQLRASAISDAQIYIPVSFRKPHVRANRNWAYERGGPLYGGSEAGSHTRRGDDN